MSIYTDSPSQSLSVLDVASHLERLGVRCRLRGDWLDAALERGASIEEIACLTASCVVTELERPLDTPVHPRPAALEAEVRRLKRLEPYPRRLLYDGQWLVRIYHRLLWNAEGSLSGVVPLVFTGRLLVTWGERRYHARVLVGDEIVLLSTVGLIEGPARPREYYIAKAVLGGREGWETIADEMFEGRYLRHDDPLVTEAMKSYALQALFYAAFGQAFCEDEGCCLYNSHWQEEVLRVQVGGTLCERCRRRLELAAAGRR